MSSCVLTDGRSLLTPRRGQVFLHIAQCRAFSFIMALFQLPLVNNIEYLLGFSDFSKSIGTIGTIASSFEDLATSKYSKFSRSSYAEGYPETEHRVSP
jgi:hypothetical protein